MTSEPIDPVAALRRIAFLLERRLADSYRIKAYRGAAATLLTVSPDDVRSRAEAGTLRQLPGVGAKTAAIVEECLAGEVRSSRAARTTVPRCAATCTCTPTGPTADRPSRRWR